MGLEVLDGRADIKGFAAHPRYGRTVEQASFTVLNGSQVRYASGGPGIFRSRSVSLIA